MSVVITLTRVDNFFHNRIINKLQFGYAYDFATTPDLRRVNRGSREIILD